MTSTGAGAIGTVVLAVDAPEPVFVLVSVHDAAGREIVRRRVRDRRVVLTLPTGEHRVTVTDERSPHDPSRLAGTTVDVTVARHGLVEVTATLTHGAVLRTTTTRLARVGAVHADGERVETRADGLGRAVLGGLRAGVWTVVALDARRVLGSDGNVVSLAPGGLVDLDLATTTRTGRLLVEVRGGDRRPVLAAEVAVTDPTGRTVTAPVRGGLADVRGLRPGCLRVVVPPSVGHLGTALEVEVGAGSLGHVTVVSPVGASITGRVVQHGARHRRPYAAVVALLDEDGVEVERVRTDEAGRFTLGTGLAARDGLTVVATSGPETLHVTRAAVADLGVLHGVRHDLGDVALPVGGPAAVWRARTPAVAGMKLPSTRV